RLHSDGLEIYRAAIAAIIRGEIMKREKSTARWTRNLLAVCLMVLACAASARAQVIPTVCFESKPETLTRTLSNSLAAGGGNINAPRMTQAIPLGFYKVIFNPGGATEESFPISYVFNTSDLKLAAGSNAPIPPFLFAHAAGETVLLITNGQAVFGYNNTGSTAVTIPRGVSQNYFFEGNLVYPTQPSLFQPGIHENIVSVSVVSGYKLTWDITGSRAVSTASADQGCATITYQGRLSDGAAAANGQYDLQFQAFDLETGGIIQSELITRENVQVTNGIFTVPLFFGSTLTNNFKPRFLEIGVRPGISTGAFTTLTPRQPLTQVPFAVNAQTAQTAFDVRLQLTVNAPPTAECNETSEHGRMKADAANNRLWVCTTTGWKSTVLQ
ncbi:MAG: hypothetical protein LH614_12895, partial [Pyrinomonadaceae bacterium]|nr:hypothetical protein [Pyrinomonadaceae bacterium]